MRQKTRFGGQRWSHAHGNGHVHKRTMPAAWHQQEKLVANPKLGCSGREAATGPRQHQIQAWQCRLQATNDDPRKEKKRNEKKDYYPKANPATAHS